jgi:hypothetical protein
MSSPSLPLPAHLPAVSTTTDPGRPSALRDEDSQTTAKVSQHIDAGALTEDVSDVFENTLRVALATTAYRQCSSLSAQSYSSGWEPSASSPSLPIEGLCISSE